jgi:hypothetical protein
MLASAGIIGAHRLWINMWTGSRTRRITPPGRGVTASCPAADAQVSTAFRATAPAEPHALWTLPTLTACGGAGYPQNPPTLRRLLPDLYQGNQIR